jgi:hypothetical protein
MVVAFKNVACPKINKSPTKKEVGDGEADLEFFDVSLWLLWRGCLKRASAPIMKEWACQFVV